jgi:hypothetical protein
MQIVNSIGQALFTSFSMFWEILWPLILGFTLSGIVQAVVSHDALNASNLLMRPEFGAEEQLHLAQTDCRYDEAPLREPG